MRINISEYFYKLYGVKNHTLLYCVHILYLLLFRDITDLVFVNGEVID